jgi:hypothetical protein
MMTKSLDTLQIRLTNADLVGFHIGAEPASGGAMSSLGKATEAKSGLVKPDAPFRAGMAKHGMAKSGLSKVGAIKT